MALKISEEAAVQMPMKTVASLICMVAIGTWAYFGIIETQNKIQTTVELMQKQSLSIWVTPVFRMYFSVRIF